MNAHIMRMKTAERQMMTHPSAVNSKGCFVAASYLKGHQKDTDAHERPRRLITKGEHRTTAINPSILGAIYLTALKRREGKIEDA